METLLAIVTAVGGLLSGIATVRAVTVSRQVAETQKQLSQRQLLLPLWDYMTKLNNIDPTSPVVPDVVNVVNTLELVALCVEGGMVDPQVIRRTFRDGYIERFRQVKACQELKGMNGKTGTSLLEENRAALDFYEQLMEERRKQDKPKALS